MPIRIDSGWEPAPAKGKHKKTRRWCRGKRGVEHVSEWRGWDVVKNAAYLRDWEILICSNCGRHLDFRRKKANLEGQGIHALA